ncbi:stage III sporulation protein AA [Clostridium algidicarnis]|uniref:stage III sporulation protein AA n=1 Tax=Clostridium algidicarnis TaxID=37659 RepID=UPI001C0B8976|nr:stage III sporulation protein AA [Clostridium algidicarnis]MBU3195468.1 stage III sporulation protein AA [Clostridium algidicarnis]MBU3208428.1 stage III sporulation protein AA [Clostridium algidicarnis]MBU3226976.1 stage III sporulation protein AA [Clostridium algidicarnis]MBU3250113.1 stage III sporulation protein AA [Clostridium algidicarnis]
MNTNEIINILPKEIILKLEEIKDFNCIQEIRLRTNRPLIIQINQKEIIKPYLVTKNDIKTILQRISNYSLYAFEEEIRQGYITIKGGHRVGIAGDCVQEKEGIKTIRTISSLNIRICKEVRGCGLNILPYVIEKGKILNTIIISPPKCGKTTILRDITRCISDGDINKGLQGKKVVIIDERSEIAACFEGVPQLNVGIRTDVYDNCMKSYGIIMAIRSMGPEVIISDEIGSLKDMESILLAMNSGVNIITTIHGSGIEDMKKRSVFKDILEEEVFRRAVVLSNRNGVGTIDYIYDFKDKKVIYGEKNYG